MMKTGLPALVCQLGGGAQFRGKIAPVAIVKELLMPQTPSERRFEILTSWKEIASFLGKGVRTVQRWEATLGLPVIRPANGRSGIVMARPSDLEAWLLNGRYRSHRNSDGQGKKNGEVHATFTAYVQELRRYHAEVRSLCDQMKVTRETLQHEIERLRFLCGEWHAIRARMVSEENPPRVTKAN